MIDRLAAEYGWSKGYILNEIYIDEIPELERWAKKRNAQRNLEQLDIISFPYGTKEHKRNLLAKYRSELMEAAGILKKEAKLDKVALGRLKVITGGKAAEPKE